MNIFFNLIRRLLPRGKPWEFQSEVFQDFTEGLLEEFETIRVFNKNTQLEILPETADDLIQEWFIALGLPYDSSLPLVELQATAKSRDTAFGSQDITYLQSQIDQAGLNVTIYELNYAYVEPTAEFGTMIFGDFVFLGFNYDVFEEFSSIFGESIFGVMEFNNDGIFNENDASYYYLLVGSITASEFLNLQGLVDYLFPLHMVPIYEITII